MSALTSRTCTVLCESTPTIHETGKHQKVYYCTDHITFSARKSWYSLRQLAAAARSVEFACGLKAAECCILCVRNLKGWGATNKTMSKLNSSKTIKINKNINAIVSFHHHKFQLQWQSSGDSDVVYFFIFKALDDGLCDWNMWWFSETLTLIKLWCLY
jgi:hypothetical protein